MAANSDIFLREREKNRNKTERNFEAIIRKYNKPFPRSDIIDLQNMRITKSRGDISRSARKTFGKCRLACDEPSDMNIIKVRQSSKGHSPNTTRLGGPESLNVSYAVTVKGVPYGIFEEGDASDVESLSSGDEDLKEEETLSSENEEDFSDSDGSCSDYVRISRPSSLFSETEDILGDGEEDDDLGSVMSGPSLIKNRSPRTQDRLSFEDTNSGESDYTTENLEDSVSREECDESEATVTYTNASEHHIHSPGRASFNTTFTVSTVAKTSQYNCDYDNLTVGKNSYSCAGALIHHERTRFHAREASVLTPLGASVSESGYRSEETTVATIRRERTLLQADMLHTGVAPPFNVTVDAAVSAGRRSPRRLKPVTLTRHSPAVKEPPTRCSNMSRPSQVFEKPIPVNARVRRCSPVVKQPVNMRAALSELDDLMAPRRPPPSNAPAVITNKPATSNLKLLFEQLKASCPARLKYSSPPSSPAPSRAMLNTKPSLNPVVRLKPLSPEQVERYVHGSPKRESSVIPGRRYISAKRKLPSSHSTDSNYDTAGELHVPVRRVNPLSPQYKFGLCAQTLEEIERSKHTATDDADSGLSTNTETSSTDSIVVGPLHPARHEYISKRKRFAFTRHQPYEKTQSPRTSRHENARRNDIISESSPSKQYKPIHERGTARSTNATPVKPRQPQSSSSTDRENRANVSAPYTPSYGLSKLSLGHRTSSAKKNTDKTQPTSRTGTCPDTTDPSSKVTPKSSDYRNQIKSRPTEAVRCSTPVKGRVKMLDISMISVVPRFVGSSSVAKPCADMNHTQSLLSECEDSDDSVEIVDVVDTPIPIRSSCPCPEEPMENYRAQVLGKRFSTVARPGVPSSSLISAPAKLKVARDAAPNGTFVIKNLQRPVAKTTRSPSMKKTPTRARNVLQVDEYHRASAEMQQSRFTINRAARIETPDPNPDDNTVEYYVHDETFDVYAPDQVTESPSTGVQLLSPPKPTRVCELQRAKYMTPQTGPLDTGVEESADPYSIPSDTDSDWYEICQKLDEKVTKKKQMPLARLSPSKSSGDFRVRPKFINTRSRPCPKDISDSDDDICVLTKECEKSKLDNLVACGLYVETAMSVEKKRSPSKLPSSAKAPGRYNTRKLLLKGSPLMKCPTLNHRNKRKVPVNRQRLLLSSDDEPEEDSGANNTKDPQCASFTGATSSFCLGPGVCTKSFCFSCSIIDSD